MTNSFNDGLEAAAALLTGTAADYEEMAAQTQKEYDKLLHDRTSLFRTATRARLDRYTDMALVLRGQAKRIFDLKKK